MTMRTNSHAAPEILLAMPPSCPAGTADPRYTPHRARLPPLDPGGPATFRGGPAEADHLDSRHRACGPRRNASASAPVTGPRTGLTVPRSAGMPGLLPVRA